MMEEVRSTNIRTGCVGKGILSGKKDAYAIIKMQISWLWNPRGEQQNAFACTDNVELLERTFNHWMQQRCNLVCFLSFLAFTFELYLPFFQFWGC